MKNSKTILAVFLILFGVVAYLGNFIPVLQLHLFWPVIFIIIGLGIMFKELS